MREWDEYSDGRVMGGGGSVPKTAPYEKRRAEQRQRTTRTKNSINIKERFSYELGRKVDK